MKILAGRERVLLLSFVCAVLLSLATASFGQGTRMRSNSSQDQEQGVAPALNSHIDPQEDAAYNAFHAVSARDSKKKIHSANSSSKNIRRVLHWCGV